MIGIPSGVTGVEERAVNKQLFQQGLNRLFD